MFAFVFFVVAIITLPFQFSAAYYTKESGLLTPS